jgi:hypothetical protein
MSVEDYAGLRRQFDVGLRFAPTRACAALAAKSIAAVLDQHPLVAVRLVDLSPEGSRVHVTLAVCLGTIDSVKGAAPESRQALALLQILIDAFAAYDPAFVQLPVDRDGRRASMVDSELRNFAAAV